MHNWFLPSWLTFILWSLTSQLALAQHDDGSASSGGGSWVTLYVLVILGIALGLLPVCHPAKRKSLDDDEGHFT